MSSDIPAPVDPPRATFKQVFAASEFRALVAAEVFSVAGDQLARIALTVLVYDRTRSALLAALTYAVSIVPTFAGGVLLSGLADRLPRRELMITCDIARALLVAAMAFPGMPVLTLVIMLFLVTLVGAPFSSARAALYPDILKGDAYVLGTAVTLTTLQFAQVVGFAAGGVVVGFFGVHVSLVVDAATFLLSALITLAWIQHRPAAAQEGGAANMPRPGPLAGVRLVFGDTRLRTPMLLGWLAAFTDLYEGVAAPLAKSLGGGAVSVGVILASGAFGATAGAIAFSRFVPPRQRLRWTQPLAVSACTALAALAIGPDLAGTLVILGVAGGCTCYQLAVNAAFVAATPPAQRSQAFGLAQGGISLGQGSAIVLAGAAANYVSPSVVIGCGGAVGILASLAIIFSGHWPTRVTL